MYFFFFFGTKNLYREQVDSNKPNNNMVGDIDAQEYMIYLYYSSIFKNILEANRA